MESRENLKSMILHRRRDAVLPIFVSQKRNVDVEELSQVEKSLFNLKYFKPRFLPDVIVSIDIMLFPLKVRELKKMISEQLQDLDTIDSFSLVLQSRESDRILYNLDEILNYDSYKCFFVCVNDDYTKIFIHEGIINSIEGENNQQVLDYVYHYFEKSLPFPKDREECKSRVRNFNYLHSERNNEFKRNSIEGYIEARRLFYYALRYVSFVEDVAFSWNKTEEEAKKMLVERFGYPGQPKSETHAIYLRNIRRCTIARKRIIKCCIFLKLYDEAMMHCKKILETIKNCKILGVYETPRKVNIYSDIAKIFTAQKRFSMASDIIIENKKIWIR